jgi:transcriptional regulator with XRE-family HTH domain
MKNRIREYMEFKQITSSELADFIGVQRSNVSHVLSGRNNPGSTFIEKLLQSYPELNARWLILGEGDMITVKAEPSAPVVKPDLFSEKVKPAEIRKETNPVVLPDILSSGNSKIEQVILFYSDKSFVVYKPS